MPRNVDIWYGADGFAIKLEGNLLSNNPNDHNLYEIEVTDKEFLEQIGFEKPAKELAKKLKDDCFVSYDSYCWSEKDLIKSDPNGNLWPVTISRPQEVYDKSIELLKQRFLW